MALEKDLRYKRIFLDSCVCEKLPALLDDESLIKKLDFKTIKKIELKFKNAVSDKDTLPDSEIEHLFDKTLHELKNL